MAEVLTAPKTYAGRHQSICKSSPFGKDIYLCFANA